MPAGACFLAYKLIRFRRWGDEIRWAPRFLLWLGLMIVELTIENGMVW